MSRMGRLASLASIAFGASAVATATALQLCANKSNEFLYDLGIEELTRDEYLVPRIGAAAIGVALMYAGKKGFKYCTPRNP